MKRLIIVIALAASCFAALANPAFAKAPALAPGITLSPASEQINVQSDETQHQLQFKISNNEPTAQTIKITTADFNTLGESGGLVFVGTNPTAIQKKYGLASWLSLPQNSVTIAPKQSATVRAYILNQPSLAPGGHYGALLLNLNSDSSSFGQNKVALHPIASSLLFVDKVGGDTHILNLSNVYISHSIVSLPSSVTLRFKNDGNTHLVPRGIVTITSSSGRLISRGIINENSGLILPQSYRRFYVPLNQIASATRPGKYNVRVDFRFDGISQFRSYQTSVFLLPIVIIFGLLALVTVIAIVLKARPSTQKIKKLSAK